MQKKPSVVAIVLLLRSIAVLGFAAVKESYARRLESEVLPAPGFICRHWRMTTFKNQTNVRNNMAPAGCCQCTCSACPSCICPACDQCNGVTWAEPPYVTFGRSTWTGHQGSPLTDRGYFWPLYVTNTKDGNMHKHTFEEMKHPMYMPNNEMNHAKSSDTSSLPEYTPGAKPNIGRRSHKRDGDGTVAAADDAARAGA